MTAVRTYIVTGAAGGIGGATAQRLLGTGANVLGVDISKVWLLVFGLGVGLAALGGVLAGPMRSVSPEMGSLVLAEAFVVTVIGGLGSLLGSVVAGLLVGVAISMTALFAPEMATIVMFALMAIVLLIRPQGLFGKFA